MNLYKSYKYTMEDTGFRTVVKVNPQVWVSEKLCRSFYIKISDTWKHNCNDIDISLFYNLSIMNKTAITLFVKVVMIKLRKLLQ